MDASKVSVSELLPYTEAEGELSWGSEEGLAWRKDELVSSWIQVKWFSASVLLKAGSLNIHIVKGEVPCEDIFFHSQSSWPVLDTIIVPWE